jgi:hypothetical protein
VDYGVIGNGEEGERERVPWGKIIVRETEKE